MQLKVVITKGEDGWYVVTVPSLPGYVSYGKDHQRGKTEYQGSIALYLEPKEDIVPGKGARVVEVAV